LKPSKTELRALSRTFSDRATAGETNSFFGLMPDIDFIFTSTGETSRIFENLLSDPHVWACVQSRKSGVLSSEWRMEYPKSTESTAKIIDPIFAKLDIYNIVSWLLDAPLYGFSALEIVWKFDGKWIVPDIIEQRPNYWFEFDTENQLRFLAEGEPNGIILPKWKFIIARHFPSFENPYGKRLLSRCFWPVTFKRSGTRFWMLYMEKYGVPWIIGKVPKNTTDERRAEILDMLTNMLQDAVAVIDTDQEVDTLKINDKNATTDLFYKMLEFSNAEISKAVLSQTLTTEIGDKGAYAAASAHLSVRQEVCDFDKKLVIRALNELISLICLLNFGDPTGPIFTFVEDSDVRLDLAQRDVLLQRMGVRFTQVYYERNYNFRQDEFTLTKPEPQGGTSEPESDDPDGDVGTTPPDDDQSGPKSETPTDQPETEDQ